MVRLKYNRQKICSAPNQMYNILHLLLKVFHVLNLEFDGVLSAMKS
jgi:hypothetical protein